MSVHLLRTLVLLYINTLNGVWSDSVSGHLEKGKKLLQDGNLPEALEQYNLAVAGDPSNYLTYFKRAAVYLALGQAKKSLPDLGKVLELKPDFHQARLERANTNVKLGKVSAAQEDYQILASSENSATEEAKEMLSRSQTVQQYIENIDHLMSKGDYTEDLLHQLQVSIELCPWYPHLRSARAVYYEHTKQYQSAISDIKMLTKLIPDNTEGYYKISSLYYQLGEEEDSLREIRECLKLDQDHKDCYPLYKKLKKLVKQLEAARKMMEEERFEEAIDKLKNALKTESESVAILIKIKTRLCTSHTKISSYDDGMKWCNEVLELDPENIDVLCDKSELYISNEEYEEAIKLYQHTLKINDQFQRAKDGLNRAQNLLKQSQKRDYYKILGVKRNASVKEINKAYRRLAKEWHPDKYDGEDKKKAEKMFYDIAAAKEVLTDKEMRSKFDNGEDPLDPEQQHGGGGHGGFPHGFPFGGGGFTFKFNF
ncbi:PREDICTED: dnaJ homolog subfamily C member 3-like [Amphimedon queenslandica]|uniref:J domain-containing protein n=1 Tax=Amphimedon queenslandica TaxID=400682 RepID=A0A1X7TMA4_AMPQE|nr:PREDICTED: dnaJ homolog subfamily C member 3-like [Amphimedon queenslandica]|eukprot:XP_003390240.1 PREDICTED: dnaJ homolog subfamily C member 3-like [Amphimedon queenslandica]